MLLNHALGGIAGLGLDELQNVRDNVQEGTNEVNGDDDVAETIGTDVHDDGEDGVDGALDDVVVQHLELVLILLVPAAALEEAGKLQDEGDGDNDDHEDVAPPLIAETKSIQE